MRGTPVPVAAWGRAEAALLQEVAARDATRLAGLFARAEAARRAAALPSAPGAARIRLAAVTGAPGDGNAALTERMRASLTAAGYAVQEGATGAAYGLSGRVSVVPAGPRSANGWRSCWTVTRADGRELGRVFQLNEVPAREALAGAWGPVAAVVAEEAAGGVRQVLENAGRGAAGAGQRAVAATASPRVAGIGGQAQGGMVQGHGIRPGSSRHRSRRGPVCCGAR